MMTIRELKELIANLPDDATIQVNGEPGEYADYLSVSFPRQGGRSEVIFLDEFKPGETYDEYKARKWEEGRKGREFAIFLDRLLNEKLGDA